MCRYAKLDDATLKQIKGVEGSLGVYLLAVERMRKPAKLTTQQLTKIQNLEKELKGPVLVAYE